MKRLGSRVWREAAVFACLAIAFVIIAYGAYVPLGLEDPPPTPSVTMEDKRQAFMDRLKEHAGIEKVEARRVKVGPKFATLTPEEKETVVNLLAFEVYGLRPHETLRPDQKFVVVESAMGKQVATFTADGLKLSE